MHQDLPIKGWIRSLFVIDVIDRTQVLRDGFDRKPAKDTTMLHVDWVKSKVKVVPHFDNPLKMCGIRMWDARDATWDDHDDANDL